MNRSKKVITIVLILTLGLQTSNTECFSLVDSIKKGWWSLYSGAKRAVARSTDSLYNFYKRHLKPAISKEAVITPKEQVVTPKESAASLEKTAVDDVVQTTAKKVNDVVNQKNVVREAREQFNAIKMVAFKGERNPSLKKLFENLAKHFITEQEKRYESIIRANGYADQVLVSDYAKLGNIVGTKQNDSPIEFIEKINLENQSAEIKMFTDLHADAQSLIMIINKLNREGFLGKDGNPFKIVNAHNRIVFLGDATGRGKYPLETWLLLLLLQKYNEKSVVLIKGNHDVSSFINRDELSERLSSDRDLLRAFFFYLPSAYYVMCRYQSSKDQGPKNRCFLLCHGGPDVRYSSQKFLADKTRTCDLFNFRKQGPFVSLDSRLNAYYQKQQNDYSQRHMNNENHFIWNDFAINARAPYVLGQGNRMAFARAIMITILRKGMPQGVEFVGLIRGHQHAGFGNELRKKGVYFLDKNLHSVNQSKKEWSVDELTQDGHPFFATIDAHPSSHSRGGLLTLILPGGRSPLLKIEQIFPVQGRR